MENIHILPTDKPSRLCIDYKNNLCLSESDLPYVKSNEWKTFPQNIYITSDEEIKEGDWCIDDEGIVKCTAHAGAMNHYYSKIILTTDDQLIKDGVQAIDDEFLEWFVKNPSCEFVEVQQGFADGSNYGYNFLDYKIIIPKEEPKKHIVVLAGKDAVKEGFKQETLKEVAKRLSNTTDEFNQFVAGAKWQQEQNKKMYSEEEVLEQLNLLYGMKNSLVDTFTDENDYITMKWFEQFKKK
jgi:hypothetical protein